MPGKNVREKFHGKLSVSVWLYRHSSLRRYVRMRNYLFVASNDILLIVKMHIPRRTLFSSENYFVYVYLVFCLPYLSHAQTHILSLFFYISFSFLRALDTSALWIFQHDLVLYVYCTGHMCVMDKRNKICFFSTFTKDSIFVFSICHLPFVNVCSFRDGFHTVVSRKNWKKGMKPICMERKKQIQIDEKKKWTRMKNEVWREKSSERESKRWKEKKKKIRPKQLKNEFCKWVYAYGE